MESDNWIVQNLENALDMWNSKLKEIWNLITQSPETFKDGAVWGIMQNIHGALQAIAYALLVLFFVVGIMKTCGSFAELKKPEHALKLFIRFVLAKAAISYGLELMMGFFSVIQGIMGTIMDTAGIEKLSKTHLPDEIITAVEDTGFFESIPIWAVTLIGGLVIWVLAFIMILTVYGRFLSSICTRPLHRFRWRLSLASQRRTSAKVFSRAMRPCVWRGRSSYWLVSSFL
jgi:hypothetical protein